MTDRELLELAAKAAGIVGEVDEFYLRLGDSVPILGINNETGAWFPLTDDGDALRLAVDLNLVIEIQKETGSVWVSDNDVGQLENPAPDADWHAATRRAIVRAAAAIGGKA